MKTNLRNFILIGSAPVLLGIALAAGLTWPRAVDSKPAAKEAAKGSLQKWVKVSVDLPASRISFPPGDGSVIANAECLVCHSAGMVLRQPSLTQDEWVGEINKMRNVFGATLPPDQVEPLAKYLLDISRPQSSGD